MSQSICCSQMRCIVLVSVCILAALLQVLSPLDDLASAKWELVDLGLEVGWGPSSALVDGRMQVVTYSDDDDDKPVILVSG